MVFDTFKSGIFNLSPNEDIGRPGMLAVHFSDFALRLKIFSPKTNVKRTDNYVGLSNLSIHYTWKNIKYQIQLGMTILKNLSDYILSDI